MNKTCLDNYPPHIRTFLSSCLKGDASPPVQKLISDALEQLQTSRFGTVKFTEQQLNQLAYQIAAMQCLIRREEAARYLLTHKELAMQLAEENARHGPLVLLFWPLQALKLAVKEEGPRPKRQRSELKPQQSSKSNTEASDSDEEAVLVEVALESPKEKQEKAIRLVPLRVSDSPHSFQATQPPQAILRRTPRFQPKLASQAVSETRKVLQPGSSGVPKDPAPCNQGSLGKSSQPKIPKSCRKLASKLLLEPVLDSKGRCNKAHPIEPPQPVASEERGALQLERTQPRFLRDQHTTQACQRPSQAAHVFEMECSFEESDTSLEFDIQTDEERGALDDEGSRVNKEDLHCAPPQNFNKPTKVNVQPWETATPPLGSGRRKSAACKAQMRAPARLLALRPVELLKLPEEETLCSVCGGEDGDDPENLVLLCENTGCQVAVHQQCYGLASLPSGVWKCDGCLNGVSPTASSCALCPCSGGALRRVVSLSPALPAYVEENRAFQSPCQPVMIIHPNGCRKQQVQGCSESSILQQLWVHSACALWCPEAEFADPERLDGVRLGLLTQHQINLQCSLCSQGGGSVVQCNFATCDATFHPLCARNQGWMLPIADSATCLAFCGLHSHNKYATARDKMIAKVP